MLKIHGKFHLKCSIHFVSSHVHGHKLTNTHTDRLKICFPHKQIFLGRQNGFLDQTAKFFQTITLFSLMVPYGKKEKEIFCGFNTCFQLSHNNNYISDNIMKSKLVQPGHTYTRDKNQNTLICDKKMYGSYYSTDWAIPTMKI